MSWRTDLVDRQVAAFNAHDIAAFIACYREGAVVADAAGDAAMAGVDQIREQYGALFQQVPDLAVRIDQRIEAGEWVVDREVARVGDEERIVAVAYRVQEDGIDRVVQLD